MSNYVASVIIPTYNTAMFIKSAVLSCLRQKIDLEIIIIDDGSTDKTYQNLSTLIATNRNIKYFYHENIGLGPSRNRGIDESSSPFIFFLDSDDEFNTNSLHDIYKMLKYNNLDMFGFSSDKIINENKYDSFQYIKPQIDKSISGINFLSQININKISFSSVLWAYSKDFINKNEIKFHNKLHEDEGFTFECLYRANKVMTTEVPVYLRRIRGGSITSKVRTLENSEGWIESIRQIQKLKSKDNLNNINRVIHYRSLILLANATRVKIPILLRIKVIYNGLRLIGLKGFIEIVTSR